MKTKGKTITGQCIQCNSEIIVDLADRDEIWAQRELITHEYHCPSCKLLGNFIECVRFDWTKSRKEHILTKTEIKFGKITLAGKQYKRFFPLMIHLPDEIDIFVRKKRCNRKLGKYLNRMKFEFWHPYLKKFKPKDLISIEVGSNYIRIRKI